MRILAHSRTCAGPSRPPVADRIPGPGRVFVALVVLGYRLGRRALPYLAAALTVGGVYAWRWHSGSLQLGRRPRRYARHVHATGRTIGTGVGTAALVNWRLTALSLAVVFASLAAAALIARNRRRPAPAKNLPPRRVRVRVGPPVAVAGVDPHPGGRS